MRTPLDDQALLVRVGPTGGQLFLLWHGRRLPTDDASLRSLGLDSAYARPVSAAFVDAVPVGTSVRADPIPGDGSSAAPVGSRPTRVGDVVPAADPAGSQSFYLVLADGLTPITATRAALHVGVPGRDHTPLDVGTAAVNAAGQSRTRIGSDELPATVPRLADVPAGAPVCARTETGSVIPTITAGRPALDGAIPVTGSTTGPVTTDQVLDPAGRAALVSRLTADRTPTGGRYLVADDGRRFAVPTDVAAASLGYGGVTPVGIPGPLLDLLPTGPALDPATAGHGPG